MLHRPSIAADTHEFLGCHPWVGRAKAVDKTHEGRTEELNEPHAVLCCHPLVSALVEARLPAGCSHMLEVFYRVILVWKLDFVAEAALVLELCVAVVLGCQPLVCELVRVLVVESAQEMAAAALVL